MLCGEHCTLRIIVTTRCRQPLIAPRTLGCVHLLHPWQGIAQAPSTHLQAASHRDLQKGVSKLRGRHPTLAAVQALLCAPGHQKQGMHGCIPQFQVA